MLRFSKADAVRDSKDSFRRNCLLTPTELTAPHWFLSRTWRVGGLSKWVVSRLISTLKGTLIGVMVLISP